MTSTKSITLFDLLSDHFPNGQKARVTTDNSLYGMTVAKVDDMIVNCRTGEPIVLIKDLLNTRVQLIEAQKEVSLQEFLTAYKEGKKVKVQVGEFYRILQKNEDISFVSQDNPFMAILMSPDNVMTMKELIEGTFYVLE